MVVFRRVPLFPHFARAPPSPKTRTSVLSTFALTGEDPARRRVELPLPWSLVNPHRFLGEAVFAVLLVPLFFSRSFLS